MVELYPRNEYFRWNKLCNSASLKTGKTYLQMSLFYAKRLNRKKFVYLSALIQPYCEVFATLIYLYQVDLIALELLLSN